MSLSVQEPLGPESLTWKYSGDLHTGMHARPGCSVHSICRSRCPAARSRDAKVGAPASPYARCDKKL